MAFMNKRRAVCIVVDGLRASALGCYGNTSFPTPHLDELASRSVVADWLWADSVGIPNFYRNVWQGVHNARSVADVKELPELLHDAGVRQWLVSDDAWLAKHIVNQSMDEALLLESSAHESADSIEQTQLAMLFSETVLRLNEWLENCDDEESGLLWLHSRGLTGPWDAPIELRNELLDELDPEAMELLASPELLEQNDPDVLHAYRVAYAAQVAVLDLCIAGFYEALGEFFSGSETLVMLVGARGFSLGEHGTIGWNSSALYSENLHLPWLLGTLYSEHPLQRHNGMSHPSDIYATLLDWFGVEQQSSDALSHLPLLQDKLIASRQLAFSTGPDSEQAIRTPSWYLTKRDEQSNELYTKPDDHWEFNDVSSLCPEIVRGLEAEIEESLACASSGKALPTVPQDKALVSASR